MSITRVDCFGFCCWLVILCCSIFRTSEDSLIIPVAKQKLKKSKPWRGERGHLTQKLGSVHFQDRLEEVQQVSTSKVTINHSLKFVSGLSSKGSCMNNVKRKLALTANTDLGLGQFDKEDVCVSQRIWCRVASNDEHEVFRGI